MRRSGFTMIEILVIIAGIVILSIALLISLNPLEQLRKGWDMAVLKVASDIHSSIVRIYSTNLPLPWNENLEAVTFTSAEGKTLIENITSQGELKTGVSQLTGKRFSDIYFTAEAGKPDFTICFLPRSKTFTNLPETRYNKVGQIVADCQAETCHYCIASIPPEEDDEGEIATPPPRDYCAEFDPEYPKYPLTSNLSDKYSIYGCTTYSTLDYSCSDYVWWTWNTPCRDICKTGQRCLGKVYSANPADGFSKWLNCLTHSKDIKEYYCVDEPFANCQGHPLPASYPDFEFGCTNPTRPMKWAGIEY